MTSVELRVFVPLGAFEPVEILNVEWVSNRRVVLVLQQGLRRRTLIVTAAGLRAIASVAVSG